MVDYVFILAGGSGTRLWPASTADKPKQFLPFADGGTLLEATVERALEVGVRREIVIITLKEQAGVVIDECKKLKRGKDKIAIIPEPTARNTAPAIALGVKYAIDSAAEDSSILVLAADHLIQPVESFIGDVEKGQTLLEEGLLVTFGIPPTEPSTGYGYIQAGKRVASGAVVESFKEKPDLKTAQQFLREGGYYWNSGMFFFTAGNFWRELETCAPEIADLFQAEWPKPEKKTESGFTVACDSPEIGRMYKKMPSISVDYAVMEKSEKSGMVETTFSWSDIGSWDEVARLNVPTRDSVYSVDSDNAYVYADRPVALCGVDDVIVVVQNGAVLVCRKGESQQVKKIVNKLKEENRTDLL